MANALIQLTQGATIVTAGQSTLGFVAGTDVTVTDNGGAGAISYAWSIISYPGPLSTPPTILNGTTQIATIVNPFVDGIYIVKLIRTDGTGTTSDIRFFGVADIDGLYLPSAGMTGTMSNLGGLAAAQAVGWAGRGSASNVLLDAYLRWLKARIGPFEGDYSTLTIDNSTANPLSQTLIATKEALREYTNTRTSNALTIRLGDTLVSGFGEGQVFHAIMQMNTGTQNVIFQSGASGPTLVTLTAPPTGSIRWNLYFYFNSTNWMLIDLNIASPLVVSKEVEFHAVTGLQASEIDIYSRIGTVRADPSKYPAGQVKFQAILEATLGQTAECRLYNLTDGGPVSGSVLIGTTETPTHYEAVVTLPSAQKDYEVQLKLGSVNAGLDRAVCTNAKILLTWG